jgi:ribosomal protein L3 glutamine methyltransferase
MAVKRRLMKTASDWIDACSHALEDGGAFFGHGTDNAGDEARWLVLTAMELDPHAVFADEGKPLDDDTVARIQSLLQDRISQRVPLAYLSGQAWFCGLAFDVSPAVLVPRSPIAELIASQFSPWILPGTARQVLDLCTGSGCIAIATARYLPGSTVDAVDISAAALEIAAGNLRKFDLEDRVTLFQSDLFSALQGKQYDLIISNPPYVSRAEFDSLPDEYHAEPEIGLVSGQDGLDIVLRILAAAPAHLQESGMLVCEVGESRPALEAVLPRVPFLWPEFESGGMGVFLLSRAELIDAADQVRALLEKRHDV